MPRPADNSIAKKRAEVMPATAAATMETKAKGSATLADSDNHFGGLFTFLGLNAGRSRRIPHLHLDDYPYRLFEPDQYPALCRTLASQVEGRLWVITLGH
jgi:hypothetical protein